jgi:hypothetical protein
VKLNLLGYQHPNKVIKAQNNDVNPAYDQTKPQTEMTAVILLFYYDLKKYVKYILNVVFLPDSWLRTASFIGLSVSVVL